MSQEIKGYQKRRCITNINSTFGKQSLDMNVQIDLDIRQVIKHVYYVLVASNIAKEHTIHKQHFSS